MRLLVMREVRRQAPAAAGMLGLGALLLLILWATLQLADRPYGGGAGFVEAVFMILAVGTPWLLSATAVAPDHETGAEAFLVTLPISRARLAIMRAAVAFALTVAVVAVTGLVCYAVAPMFGQADASHAKRITESIVAALAAGGALFAGGALATTLVRQTLVAFVLAPAIVFGPGLLYVWLADELTSIEDVVAVVAIGVSLPIVLLVAAWRAYTRPTREFGWRRPARFAAWVSGAAFLLGIGLTTTAYALDRLVPHYSGVAAELRSPTRRVVAVLSTRRTRIRWSHNNRYRPARARVFRAGTEQPIQLPQGVFPISIAPDDRTVLAVHEAGLVRLDLESGARRRAALPVLNAPAPEHTNESLTARRWSHLYYSSRSQHYPILWHEGEAWIAHQRGLLRWDGGAQRPAPKGTRIIAALGSRALAKHADGRAALIDLAATDEPSWLPPPTRGRTLEWCLGGPRGRYVVALSRDAAGAAGLYSLDREGGSAWLNLKVPLPDDAVFGVGRIRHGDRRLESARVFLTFALAGDFAACHISLLGRRREPFHSIDLRTGESAVIADPAGAPVEKINVWTPRSRLLTRSGVWDPARRRLTPYPRKSVRLAAIPALMFDGDVAVYHDVRTDIATGKTTRSPLWR